MTVAPAPAPAPAPAVVTWYKVYAVFMSLLYVLVIAAGAFFFFIPAEALEEDDPPPWFISAVFFGLGFPLLAVYGASIFLPPRPWVWIYDIVLICLGFTSCLTLPFCIPLLIFWLKPETKAHFGRV